MICLNKQHAMLMYSCPVFSNGTWHVFAESVFWSFTDRLHLFVCFYSERNRYLFESSLDAAVLAGNLFAVPVVRCSTGQAEIGVALAHGQVTRTLLSVTLRLTAAAWETVLTCTGEWNGIEWRKPDDRDANDLMISMSRGGIFGFPHSCGNITSSPMAIETIPKTSLSKITQSLVFIIVSFYYTHSHK